MRQHGTRAKYVVEKCRCVPCTEANNLYMRDLAARNLPAWRVRMKKGKGRIWQVVSHHGHVEVETRDEDEARRACVVLRRQSSDVLDFGPLLELVDRECSDRAISYVDIGQAIAGRFGGLPASQTRMIHRAKQRGWVTHRHADQIAVALGLDLNIIYPSSLEPVWADKKLRAEAVAHLKALRAVGIGRRVIKDLGSLHSKDFDYWSTRVRGQQWRRMKFSTAQKVLAVPLDAHADGTLVDATETWRLINEMIAAGATKNRIASALLGRPVPALQVNKHTVRASTARAVRELHDRFYIGSERMRQACRCEDALAGAA